MKPMPPAVEAYSPKYWTTREFPRLEFSFLFFFFKIISFIYSVVLDWVFVSLGRLSSCGAWAYLPCGKWDPSSPTSRDPTGVPCTAGWTTREVPRHDFSAYANTYIG